MTFGITELEIDSPLFRDLCARLNDAEIDANATWRIDLLAGAHAFSDEFPIAADEPLEVVLACVKLRRVLTAYRISLIAGKPRLELAPWWEATMRLAPRWPGFAPERCGSAMKFMLKEIEERDLKFAADCERLEAQLVAQKNAPDVESGASE